jgi:hypothetical protein
VGRVDDTSEDEIWDALTQIGPEKIIPQIRPAASAPEEIARIVVFLTSEGAVFVSGSPISANGAQFFV